MHVGNVDWLKDLNECYDIKNAQLLELGSLNINGTARDYLQVHSWLGIDIQKGRDVDLVCRAVDTSWDAAPYDVILCTSMLEHDPTWRESLTHNLQWLKPGGLLFLSWGAEGNTHHLPEPWALVPLTDVETWIAANGLELLESCWERDRYTADCAGCYDMVIRKPVSPPGTLS